MDRQNLQNMPIGVFSSPVSHQLTLPGEVSLPIASICRKTTLIPDYVGGTESDPPIYKMRMIFLMSLALNVLIFNKSHRTRAVET